MNLLSRILECSASSRDRVTGIIFFLPLKTTIKLDKIYEPLDSKQYRMLTLERRGTNKVILVIVVAFCLKALSFHKARKWTQVEQQSLWVDNSKISVLGCWGSWNLHRRVAEKRKLRGNRWGVPKKSAWMSYGMIPWTRAWTAWVLHSMVLEQELSCPHAGKDFMRPSRDCLLWVKSWMVISENRIRDTRVSDKIEHRDATKYLRLSIGNLEILYHRS